MNVRSDGQLEFRSFIGLFIFVFGNRALGLYSQVLRVSGGGILGLRDVGCCKKSLLRVWMW